MNMSCHEIVLLIISRLFFQISYSLSFHLITMQSQKICKVGWQWKESGRKIFRDPTEAYVDNRPQKSPIPSKLL